MSIQKKLSNMEMNKTGEVAYIKCNGDERRRFLDLGIVKGTKVTPVLISPLGDPRAYEIRGTVIAIRKEDADKIYIFDIYE
ncbi:FeoA family protein [Anaerofustis sp.]|uniref:FeoA family protein n=1 Tax=Anaerofustis sp. TaxID=1872517 RepID=UPI0025C1BCD3|nr:FeoA family protein [Anaerofustis sp.]